MSDNKRLNQRILDRIMHDPAFKEIREKAKADKANLPYYVMQVRGEFKLSPYWDKILSWLLTYDGLIKKLPLTGAMIDPVIDSATGKEYYSIPVYPETSNDNILSAAKLIRKRYKKRGDDIDLRKSDAKKTEAEFMALSLYEAGKNYEEIAGVLNSEFDETYISTEIPTLIHKALQKSLRQEKRS